MNHEQSAGLAGPIRRGLARQPARADRGALQRGGVYRWPVRRRRHGAVGRAAIVDAWLEEQDAPGVVGGLVRAVRGRWRSRRGNRHESLRRRRATSRSGRTTTSSSFGSTRTADVASSRVLHARGGAMIQTTTPGVDGRAITDYLGVVTGEAILGANIFKDLFAGVRDIVGGRSGAYEQELRRARQIALTEMEAEAAAAWRRCHCRHRPRLRDGRERLDAHGQRLRHCGSPRLVTSAQGSAHERTAVRPGLDEPGPARARQHPASCRVRRPAPFE